MVFGSFLLGGYWLGSLASILFYSENGRIFISWHSIYFRARTYLALFLFPLILLGLNWLWELYFDPSWPPFVSLGIMILMLTSTLVLFPHFVRLIWSNRAISDPILSDQFYRCGKPHQLQKHQFRLWETGNQMINAAIVGFLPGHRMVYLTDGLVDRFPNREIQAIVRHELGHLANYHIPWRLFILSGPAALIAFSFEHLGNSGTIELIGQSYGKGISINVPLLSIIITLPIVLWMIWINHRFSHQIEHDADLYAALDPVTGQTRGQEIKEMTDALYRFAAHLPQNYHRATYFHPSLSKRIAFLKRVHHHPTALKQFQRELNQLKLSSASFIFFAGLILLILWSILS